MKIRIEDISDEGLEIEHEGRLSGGAEGDSLMASMILRVSRLGRDVFIEGQVGSMLQMTCSRCLAEYGQPLKVPVNLVYSPSDTLGPGHSRHELDGAEMNTGFYTDDAIDLGQVCHEQLLLSVPMKPLCRVDCKGICPTCGADLNEAACPCRQDETDPRLSVLKRLLDKGKEQ